MFVVKRSPHNPILAPDENRYWEEHASFNMSVVKKGSKFYGVYRAISAKDMLLTPDRVSVIGIGKSKDGIHFEKRTPLIMPLEEWEKYGCEDPRVTYFEGNYYIFYTALSRYPFEASGIKVAVAISKDLKKIKERHLVTPFNAKAMTLFPERIAGKITAILSVNTDIPPVKIAVAQVDKIEELWNSKFWEKWYKDIDKHIVDLRRLPSDHVEIGSAPLKTKEGWLLFYSHIQNYFPSPSGLGRIFGIEAVVLDVSDPFKIVGRTKGPMLVPEESYELSGNVADVVFPSGSVLEKDTLLLYYGAADTTNCVAYINLSDLLAKILFGKGGSQPGFQRFANNPIIKPDKKHPFEAKATFNPAALRLGGTTHILYRAMSEDNISSVGYAASRDGVNIDERLPEPVYIHSEDFESKKNAGGNSGCEDPRLTKIGKTLYMCYTAFDGVDLPRVAVTSISEKNFLQKKWDWQRPVLITPPGFDDKDTCLLPEKFKDGYFILHRVGDVICGDYFKSLDFKTEAVKRCLNILDPRRNGWDSAKVGITAPPMKTKKGWLLLYHGVSKSHATYRIGAVLLSLKDPAIVLARTADPVFEPEELYEKKGIVNNVVFPCGLTLQNGLLYIYYGAADTVVGVATLELDTLLRILTRFIKM